MTQFELSKNFSNTEKAPAWRQVTDSNPDPGMDNPLTHPQIWDSHPLFHAHRNFRNGQERAKQDADLLKNASNEEFVKQINSDCKVGPHLEWLTFGGALATKGATKSFVIHHIGKETGVNSKLALSAGLAMGAAGAAFLTYELADYFENSSRAQHFENRLLQNPDFVPAKALPASPENKPIGESKIGESNSGMQTPELPSIELIPEYVSKNIWGVRQVVDHSLQPALTIVSRDLLGSELRDKHEEMREKALAQNGLSNAEFTQWAARESTKSTRSQLIQDGIFSTVGTGGGIYTGLKLGFGRYGVAAVALAGTIGALAMSRLKSAAESNTERAMLYESRLLQK